MKRLSGLNLSCLLVLGMAATAVAQDPPSRVARLSYMTGQVSFEPASVDQWTQAALNYPMTTGDNLYTDNGSRAVLRIGRNAIRLNAGTNFQFVNLNDQVVQVSINSGSLSLRIRRLFPGEVWEVDTPGGAITLDHVGEFRVDADPSQNATMVTCRSGQAEMTANNQSFSVYPRQTAYVGPDGSPDIRDQNPSDEFDNFSYSRDRLEDVPPPQYVSQDLDGYEDLNANGSWRTDSTYGAVWMPRVESGWAPYQTGHWAWVEPWGWTWVDQASWGFAPFHYGRWANFGGSWGWCPGPVAIRPVYAPALVAFVGGGGFGLSIGIGGGGGGGAVGWFPLGPRDPYIPSYRVSDAYVRNVNISNTRITNINVTNVNVTNINYMNRNVPGAVVAVPQQAFASAQPVQRARMQVTPAQLQQVRVVGTAAPVVPIRASVLATPNAVRAVAPPAAIASRPVVARLAPPPAPVSFQAKQQILQQNPGRPVAPQQLQTLRQQAPAATPVRMAVRPVNAAQVRPVTPVVTPGSVPGGFAGQRAAQANQPRPAVAPGQPQGQPGIRPQGVPNPAVPNQVRPSQPGAPLAQPGIRPQVAPPATRPVPQQAPAQAPRVQPPVPQAGRPAPAPAGLPAARPQPAPPVRAVPQQAAPAPRPAPQQMAPAPRPVPQQVAPPRPQPQQVREPAPAPRPVPQQVAPPRPQPQQVREPAPAPRPVPQQMAPPRPQPQQVREPAPAQRPVPQQMAPPRPQPQQVREPAPAPRPAPQQAAPPRPQPQPQRQPPPPQRPAEEKKQ